MNYEVNSNRYMTELPSVIAAQNAMAAYLDNMAQSVSMFDALANFRGLWSALSGSLAMPATVSHSGQIYALTTSVVDVTAHTPGVSAAWQLVRATSEQITHGNETAYSAINKRIEKLGTGIPLPSSDIGPIWHDDYASIMTWRVINTYTGYASVNIGQIAFFDSSATAKGWLKAAGQTISETYAALLAYRGSFTLPDLRGEFLRGLDDGRGVDSGRALRSAQAGALQYHSHYQRMGGGIDPSIRVGTSTTDVYAFSTYNQSYGKNDISTLTSGDTGTFAPETRPRNVALLACIKY